MCCLDLILLQRTGAAAAVLILQNTARACPAQSWRSRGDMLQSHFAETNPIVWTLNFHEKSCCGAEILSLQHVPWIQISLNWRDMSRWQNNRTRKVASCELFMQQVPLTLEKNKPIRKRHLSSQKPFKKPIPATCPFMWRVHEILPRDMSLQHVPSCVPTLRFTGNIVTWVTAVNQSNTSKEKLQLHLQVKHAFFHLVSTASTLKQSRWTTILDANNMIYEHLERKEITAGIDIMNPSEHRFGFFRAAFMQLFYPEAHCASKSIVEGRVLNYAKNKNKTNRRKKAIQALNKSSMVNKAIRLGSKHSHVPWEELLSEETWPWEFVTPEHACGSLSDDMTAATGS